jgi:DNA helicase HerA-like ATPase
MAQDFDQTIKDGYRFEGAVLDVGRALRGGNVFPDLPVRLPLAMMNRHGLIAGATGTGKTKTLQLLAGELSDAGVPVFLADLKGDLSGLAKPGVPTEKLQSRCRDLKITFSPKAHPVEFLSLTGKQGAQVRATVSSFGPLLLAKVLALNDTQQGVLTLLFKFCDDHHLPILDLPDLKAVLAYLQGLDSQQLAGYGGMAKAALGVLNRKLVELEQQGADLFLGEPEFDIMDLLRTTPDGKGIVSILSLADIQDRPALFSTFMMWLLGELFHRLPERGDVDKPVLVFFFDEAHLLFEEASKALVNQIEQVVKLIRSKGVGVYFVTQTPKDIPADVLAQLGNRFQHALRAFTPDDAKALKATAGTFPRTPFYEIEKELTSLGIGEALVTVLDSQGRPTPVVATRLIPPDSFMGALEEKDFQTKVKAGTLQAKYAQAIDRESAREILHKKMALPTEAGGAARGEVEEGEPIPQPAGGRRGKPEPSLAEEILKSPLTRQIGKEVVRGLFGMLKKSLR